MTDETTPTLDDAARAQFEHDLAALPELHDLLLTHENDLLARGERSSDDPAIRYPADFDVIDLTNDRPKWLRDYSGPEADDQAERTRFARLVCGGHRTQDCPADAVEILVKVLALQRHIGHYAQKAHQQFHQVGLIGLDGGFAAPAAADDLTQQVARRG